MWANPEFRRLWLVQAAGDLGMSVVLVVLPLIAIAQRAGTFQVALLTALAGTGWLVVALPAGAVVDRFARRPLILICLVLRLLVLATLLIAAAANRLTMVHLGVACLVLGILVVFFDVAAQSMLPALLPPHLLVTGNGAVFTANSMALAAGPSIAALVIAVTGTASRALMLDGLLVLIAICALLGLRQQDSPAPRKTARPSMIGEIRHGIAFVLADSVLRRTLGCGATSNFFTAMVIAVIPVFLTRDLGTTAATAALVVSLGATGGIAGGLLVGPLARRFGVSRMMWVGKTAFGVCAVLIPAAVGQFAVGMAAAGLFALNAAFVIYNVLQVSYRQSACPPGTLGRVNATVRWIHRGTIPVGALLAGALGHSLGVRLTVAVGVIGAVAAVAWILGAPLHAIRDSFADTPRRESTIVP